MGRLKNNTRKMIASAIDNKAPQGMALLNDILGLKKIPRRKNSSQGHWVWDGGKNQIKTLRLIALVGSVIATVGVVVDTWSVRKLALLVHFFHQGWIVLNGLLVLLPLLWAIDHG